MDDDLLKEFVNESREHLATIETDLLAIEEGGADIDEELVNKVFRAAHYHIVRRIFIGQFYRLAVSIVPESNSLYIKVNKIYIQKE